jgi:hypothetical protein
MVEEKKAKADVPEVEEPVSFDDIQPPTALDEPQHLIAENPQVETPNVRVRKAYT